EQYQCSVQNCSYESTRKDNVSRHWRNHHENDNLATSLNTPESTVRLSYHPAIFTDTSAQLYSCSTFMQAATSGNITLLENIMDTGMGIDTKADDESTALHCAARAGQTAMIQHLLEKGAKIYTNGRTPLHEAILSCNIDTVRLLLHHLSKTTLLKDISNLESCLVQSGSLDIIRLYLDRLDAGSKTHDTPQRILAIASRRGKSSIVAELLSRSDVNVNKIDKGSAPIHLAAWKGDADMMDVILRHEGTIFNLEAQFKRLAPLQIAALKGHVQIVCMLLNQHGFAINNVDFSGNTPLHLAAGQGHTEVVKHLVDHENIHINCKNRTQYTPLHSAAQNGHLETVQVLLDHGDADINCTNNEQKTLLHSAAAGGHWKLLQLLLGRESIDVNRKNSYGFSALHLAARNGHLETVQVLLDHGDHFEHPSSRIYAHHLSSTYDVCVKTDVVKKLLCHADFEDANMIGPERYRRNLLLNATAGGDCDVLRVLLAHKDIDVNFLDYLGRSPLILSVEHNNIETARLLLEHKDMDLNLKCYSMGRNFRGRTLRAMNVFQYARLLGYKYMINLFLSHGAIDDTINQPTRISTSHIINISNTPNPIPPRDTVFETSFNFQSDSLCPEVQPEPLQDHPMDNISDEELEKLLAIDLDTAM
ncbi:ankyrin, partial [Clathrospora elynae]